jgi:methionine synthase I (cobalamin-dependent)
VLEKDKNPFLLSRVNEKPLILDGAMGSLLQQMGYKPDSNIWMTSLNRSLPEIIKSVHESYIDSGANIITTNTFRTNPSALFRVGMLNSAPLVKEAVNLVKESVKDLSVYIAGANAPAEDSYQKNRNLSYNQLEINHKIHIDLLKENDVHFILNETQSHIDEIKIICHHCQSNNIPYVISILFDEDLNIISGESVDYVCKYIMEHEPLAIGFNCIAPRLFEHLMEKLEIEFNWGFYLNCGGEDYFKRKIETLVDPISYIKIIEKFITFNPSFIGACCGSTPAHIKEIKKFLDERKIN